VNAQEVTELLCPEEQLVFLALLNDPETRRVARDHARGLWLGENTLASLSEWLQADATSRVSRLAHLSDVVSKTDSLLLLTLEKVLTFRVNWPVLARCLAQASLEVKDDEASDETDEETQDARA